MDSLYDMPGHLIPQAHQASTALFAEECAGFDLTSVQFAALVAIKAIPDVDATRLSALVAFDRSSSTADKRVKLLRLTLEGERLLQQVEPLAPSDRAAMLRLLAQLAAVHNDVIPAPRRAADRG